MVRQIALAYKRNKIKDWDYTLSYNQTYRPQHNIKISFELESEETVFSSIELNFNDNDPIYQTECYIDSTNGYSQESIYRSGLFFTNSDFNVIQQLFSSFF